MSMHGSTLQKPINEAVILVQFTWERYEGMMAELDAMTREEVVAMLKRNSTGFSRYSSHSELLLTAATSCYRFQQLVRCT